MYKSIKVIIFTSYWVAKSLVMLQLERIAYKKEQRKLGRDIEEIQSYLDSFMVTDLKEEVEYHKNKAEQKVYYGGK